MINSERRGIKQSAAIQAYSPKE